MTFGDLKFQPCPKCEGPRTGNRRTVFIFAEKVVTRCNKCGDLQEFEKSQPDSAPGELLEQLTRS